MDYHMTTAHVVGGLDVVELFKELKYSQGYTDRDFEIREESIDDLRATSTRDLRIVARSVHCPVWN